MKAESFDQVALAHGGGGQLTDRLLEQVVWPRLSNPLLDELLDSGIIQSIPGRPALTLDSFVVKPLFFPGGDLGRLAVCGTVNDLAVSGARPQGLALGMILEEGLPRGVLEKILDSVSEASREAGVPVITGDTKVVGRGQADGIFLTTAGIGIIPEGRVLHPKKIAPGDVLLISGTLADHGLAVMLARQMPELKSALRSDAAPLNGLIERLLAAVPGVVFLRDPTRAGLAGVASDLAKTTGHLFVLDEKRIPVLPETRHAAEMLGLDPLEVANEGKVFVVVRPEDAQKALEALRGHPYGEKSEIIGRVEKGPARCEILTAIGGRRILQKPYGEQLPRIC
ncbi:MAG: hydrogenase expression/formation protein HypE [Spirochaetes bacterium]|nr:hydrogenase expression/formation protein HypE [Spirochaetota bacterium]